MFSKKRIPRLVHRLPQMSPHEVYLRSKQEIHKRLDVLTYALGFERKICNSSHNNLQIENFFFNADELPQILDFLREHLPEVVEKLIESAERICRHKFDLLGYRGLSFGKEIDWHFDPVNGAQVPLDRWYRLEKKNIAPADRKIIWELNRHQHLVTLAKAYLLSREERFSKELVTQWCHWKASNPYPYGINWSSPLEIAFRSLSWLWVDALLHGQPAIPDEFLRELRAEQYISARHISRYLSLYSTPNTHLLGEVVALFFIGTCYPSLPGAKKWRSEGWRVIQAQAVSQVRTDGFHFEQSTYYHVYALDFFHHVLILAKRNALDVDESFETTVQSMGNVLAGISQTGVPFQMGDDDGGRVFDPSRNLNAQLMDPLVIGAAHFDRADWKALAPNLTEECVWLLGTDSSADFLQMREQPLQARSAAYSDSGIHVMASNASNIWQLAIDAGPQGTGFCGHGHADALSVQISGPNGEWLVDSGTFSYSDLSARERFRSTSAHNTLEIGGKSQADSVHAFAWENIPTVNVDRWVSTDDWDYFRADHTGYQRSPDKLLHQRSVLRTDDFWLIRDQVLGKARNKNLLISWHFSPAVDVRQKSSFSIVAQDKSGNALTVQIEAGNLWQMSLEDGACSPVYGLTLQNSIARIRANATIPEQIVTVLLPSDDDVEIRQPKSSGAVVYDLVFSCKSYRVVFGYGDWCVDSLAGNDEVALYRVGPSGEYERIGSVASKGNKKNEL